MKEAQKLNLSKSMELFQQAKSCVPGGVLGARRPGDFIPGEYPIFLDHGKGGRVTDVDGNEYIDFLCGYGPIILGYREEEVDEAVARQIREKGFCFSLTQRYQNDLAQKLSEIVPCSELSIFLKTGSDATTAAIRIARAFTGRVKVMRCGYHGWHDWCVEMKGGIPQKLYEDVYEFHYNDLDGLERLMGEHGAQTAAIIMTPFGHPLHQKMQEPKPGFLEGVRDLAHRYSSVLIFDEVRTGFRLALGGAQQYYGVKPDLAVLGKGMANGYAISVVTGNREIMMAAAEKLFISSTFFPNSDGYVAALKTIEVLQRDKILEQIWARGEKFLGRIRELMGRYPVGAELSGVAPMFFITFERDSRGTHREKRNAFYTQLIRRGVFMAPHHHSYICYRHTEQDLEQAAQAIEEALDYVAQRFGE
ncbi:MAG: aminotransferase class III-fold pyridoxal phosphate-dependent enzyme [bacterium]